MRLQWTRRCRRHWRSHEPTRCVLRARVHSTPLALVPALVPACRLLHPGEVCINVFMITTRALHPGEVCINVSMIPTRALQAGDMCVDVIKPESNIAILRPIG